MKRSTLMLALMSLAISLGASASDTDITVGKTYYALRQPSGGDLLLPKDHDMRNAFYVRLLEPSGELKSGDTCYFADGAKVRVEREYADGFAVRYVAGEATRGGCPVGSLAVVDGMPLLSLKPFPKAPRK